MEREMQNSQQVHLAGAQANGTVPGEHSKHASSTKRGPGRYHSNGHTKASLPKPPSAGMGFVLHTASPAKKARKAAIKRLGSVKAYRRELRRDREFSDSVHSEINKRQIAAALSEPGV